MFVCLTQIENKIREIVEPSLTEMGYEIVRIRVGGGSKRKTLQLMLDRVDGEGLQLGDCEKASRHIAVLLDVEDPIEQQYELEVSSPGIDRPLTRIKDFNERLNELVKVTLKIAYNGQKNYRGNIEKVNDSMLVIKDHETQELVEILYSNISEVCLIYEQKKNNKYKPKRRSK